MARQTIKTTIIAIALLVISGSALFVYFATRPATLDYGSITNIDGIPFPVQNDNVYITEKLAHTDIYLRHSILARQLVITLTFIPYQTQGLDLSIRHDSFWLSYNKIPIYRQTTNNNTDVTSSRTVTVTIPLTDKWPDKDGSVDLMIFSTTPGSGPTEDDGIADQTNWLLQDIHFSSRFTWPTRSSLVRYIKHSITQRSFL